MIAISSTIRDDCAKESLAYKEYIIIGTNTVEIKGKMSNTAYKNTTFFGTFNLKMLTFTTENDIDYRKKTFQYYKEINGNAFKIGSYIVTDIQDSDTTEEVTITAHDFGLKFALPYVSELNYSTNTITLFDVLQECCSMAGVTLKNTSITNGDFIVDSNQFIDTQTYGDVVAQIALISGNFATITEDDKLELLLSTVTNEVIEEYVELLDKRDTQPITSVCIGQKDIEGENVVLKDDDLIALYGEHWLVVSNNLFAYTQEKRTELITALFNKVKGFSYSSFESDYSFKPYMQLGDLVQFKNKDGDLVDSIVLKIDTDYDDIRLSAPSITKATVEYQQPISAIDLARRTEIIVDKQAQTITSVVSEVNDNSSSISTLTQTVNGITIDVSNIEDDVDGLSSQTAQLSLDVSQLRSEIGDVTDITTQEEGAGTLFFESINTSEPINIIIRPTSQKDISYLYPSPALFPSSSLFPQNRILRFENTTTSEIFDYTLPGNLRWYDSNNYDEFFMDYETLTCKITRKVDIDEDMVKTLKITPIEENYTYPTIALTAGDYTITMLGYPNAYMKIRLMSQNMYTSQFATRVEVTSAITQSANEINLEVAKKVGEEEIISKINQTAEAIKIQASKIDITGTLTAINNDTSTTINGNKITTGSITATQVSSAIITTTNFSAQNINADKITTGTLNGANVNVTNLNASNIVTGTISTDRLSANVITTANFSAQNINADRITAGTISTDRLSSNVITTSNFSAQNISANNITAGTLNGTNVNIINLSATNIKSGRLNITSGNYYLRMGFAEGANPSVSGLNVGYYGIKAFSGIVANHFGITDSDTGKSVSIQVQRQGGGYYYMTFTGGILTAWERY